MRDAFLKIADNPATRKHQVIQAEDVRVFYLSRAAYQDLLKFETDLAQITELILLFCESPGSFVELGAFSMISEIAERLFVIVRSKYASDESFVHLGPVLSLQNAYGAGSVFVVNDRMLNIHGDSVAAIDKAALRDVLRDPIINRISLTRQPTTFDQGRSGHLIKLIVGLIQEHGALTVVEIETILRFAHVCISPVEISKYLLCAEAVEWVKSEPRGFEVYYFALPRPDAANLILKETAKVRNKLRRRQLIREYWEKTDPIRFHGIIEFMGGLA